MIAVRCGTGKTTTLLLLLTCRTCGTGYIRTATIRNGCYTGTATCTTTVRGVWTTMTTGNVTDTIDATTRCTTTIVAAAAAVAVLSVVMMRLT